MGGMKRLNLDDYAERAKAQKLNERNEDVFCPACCATYIRKYTLMRRRGQLGYFYVYEKRRLIECSICHGNGKTAETFYVAVCNQLDAITELYRVRGNESRALEQYVKMMKDHARTWKIDRFEVRRRLDYLKETCPIIDIDIDVDETWEAT